MNYLRYVNLLIGTNSVKTYSNGNVSPIAAMPFGMNAFTVETRPANDLVLITLWIMATVESPSYLPMVFCFAQFFVNDMYGFFNWSRLRKQQKG